MIAQHCTSRSNVIALREVCVGYVEYIFYLSLEVLGEIEENILDISY